MSPSVRISLGLVALTVSILLLADAVFSIFPDEQAPLLQARMQYCESLAAQYSDLAQRGDVEPMKAAMTRAASQNADVLSLALRTADGAIISSTPAHATEWQQADPSGSTPTHVRVPIFEAEQRWGDIEVAFKPLGKTGWLAWLDSPLYRLVAITAAAGFALYMLFMRRTLRYLDPNAVVPGRVRAALDQLVEGVFLLDEDQRIVLANHAFAAKLDTTPEQLTGTEARALAWQLDDSHEGSGELPWELVRRDGKRRTGTRLQLKTPSQGLRTMSGNVAPVLDGSGKLRGIMASFDDISDIERVNAELTRSVENLEAAQEQIKGKNAELEILATRDPLTGAFNRRAFFDKLETEFDIARRDQLTLACIMADIDHFKNINDNYGHAVGDEVIKLMSATLEAHCNANGAVGRYGGEEFCVVLPGMDVHQAGQVAEQVRAAFTAACSEPASPTNGKPITASFGSSAVDLGAVDAHAMVDQADQALYQSKTGGRNRVTLWSNADNSHAVASGST